MTESVLVTGSSRGIGRAIALRLAQAGFDLVLHCRSGRSEADAVMAQVQALGRSARVLQFDVSDRAQCRAILEADVETHGAYYGVVLNAGLTRDGAFPALSEDDWDVVMRTNLDGFYNVLHPVMMPMIRRRAAGRIVCITSVSGLIGNRGQVNYSASKAGLIGAAKALAIELGFLLGTRKFECNVEHFPAGAELQIHALRSLEDDNGMGVFECHLSGPGIHASARLNVFRPPQAQNYLAQASRETRHD